MNAAPRMTDRPALDRHRKRVAPDALFLHALAADQIEERLQEVNRAFTDMVVVTGHGSFWADRFPQARVVPDADILDLEPGGADLVIHAMALHWSDDLVGQLVQCRRGLRPDGLFLGITFGSRSLAELRAALAEAEIATLGGLSPRIAPLAELRDLGSLLQRAGFALPVADADVMSVEYPHAMALMRELRAMGEANALLARDRRHAPRALFAAASDIYARHYPAAADPDRIRATVEMAYLSGWAPAEGQQKPLRPGAARTRLADALGTSETPLPDRPTNGRD